MKRIKMFSSLALSFVVLVAFIFMIIFVSTIHKQSMEDDFSFIKNKLITSEADNNYIDIKNTASFSEFRNSIEIGKLGNNEYTASYNSVTDKYYSFVFKYDNKKVHTVGIDLLAYEESHNFSDLLGTNSLEFISSLFITSNKSNEPFSFTANYLANNKKESFNFSYNNNVIITFTVATDLALFEKNNHDIDLPSPALYDSFISTLSLQVIPNLENTYSANYLDTNGIKQSFLFFDYGSGLVYSIGNDLKKYEALNKYNSLFPDTSVNQFLNTLTESISNAADGAFRANYKNNNGSYEYFDFNDSKGAVNSLKLDLVAIEKKQNWIDLTYISSERRFINTVVIHSVADLNNFFIAYYLDAKKNRNHFWFFDSNNIAKSVKNDILQYEKNKKYSDIGRNTSQSQFIKTVSVLYNGNKVFAANYLNNFGMVQNFSFNDDNGKVTIC